MSMDDQRRAAARAFGNDRLERLARTVVWHLRRLPTGDSDSEIGGFWEQFKHQVQYEHYWNFRLYEDAVEMTCALVLERVDELELTLIWMTTESFVNWEHELLPALPDLRQMVASALFLLVCGLADDEPLRSDYEEQRALDRFNRDMEANLPSHPIPDRGQAT